MNAKDIKPGMLLKNNTRKRKDEDWFVFVLAVYPGTVLVEGNYSQVEIDCFGYEYEWGYQFHESFILQACFWEEVKRT